MQAEAKGAMNELAISCSVKFKTRLELSNIINTLVTGR